MMGFQTLNNDILNSIVVATSIYVTGLGYKCRTWVYSQALDPAFLKFWDTWTLS